MSLYSVKSILPKLFPFLTSIDADKRAFGHVIQTADAPAFVLGLKELETHLQTMLHQPVGAHLSTAFTPLITLVDPEGKRAGEKHSDREKKK